MSLSKVTYINCRECKLVFYVYAENTSTLPSSMRVEKGRDNESNYHCVKCGELAYVVDDQRFWELKYAYRYGISTSVFMDIWRAYMDSLRDPKAPRSFDKFIRTLARMMRES